MTFRLLEETHINAWQTAIEHTDLTPGPIGGPEYVATSKTADGNVYVLRTDDLIIPLLKQKARHIGFLTTDLYTGVRYNSLFSILPSTNKILSALYELPPRCDINLQIPEELYLQFKETFAACHFYPREKYTYYKIQLPPDYDQWFSRPQVCRKAIRKAEHSGITVKIGEKELLQDFYKTYSASFRRWHKQGLAKQSSAVTRFEKALNTTGQHCRVAIAYHNGYPAAGLIFCLYHSSAAFLWAGLDYDYQDKRPSNLVHAEAIRYLIGQGVKDCNMGSNLGRKPLTQFKLSFAPDIRSSVVLFRHRFKRIKRLFVQLGFDGK